MRWTLPFLALLLVSGCVGDAPGTAPKDDTKRELQAPWWNVGESWTIRIERAEGATRTTTLVNFLNASPSDREHFWLGVSNRDEAIEHVFFETNPFLGRIHWEILAPHEKGMHAVMYSWPLHDGKTWSGSLFGREWTGFEAKAQPDGRFAMEGRSPDGAKIAYDYDPALHWFRTLHIVDAQGRTELRATVTDHRDAGAAGTYTFLRGRDYLDADGGRTGEEELFTVKDEGATSIAFLLRVTTSGPAAIEFIDPAGAVWHRETLALGGTADKLVEVPRTPTPGEWRLRYVGTVEGMIKVRGMIETKATI